MMDLIICGLTGEQICTLSAQRSQTVLDIKAAIYEHVSIAVHLQRLLCGTKVLRNTEILEMALPAAADALELLLIRTDKWVHEVGQDWRRLRKAPLAIRDDRDVVLEAIKHSKGAAIKFAGDEVRSDEEVMLAAMHYNATLYKYARQGLCTNRAFMIQALQQPGCLCWNWDWHQSHDLCCDRPFMLLMVRANGSTLQYASEELRADHEIVHAAIQSGHLAVAFQYAAQSLRGDRELVHLAATHNISNLGFASEELRGDREFVLSVLRECDLRWCRNGLEHVPQHLRADREIVALAIERSYSHAHKAAVLQSASQELQADSCLQAQVGYYWLHGAAATHFECASPCPTVSLETFLADQLFDGISESTRLAMQYSPSACEMDHSFMVPLLRKDPALLAYLSLDAQADRILVLEAVKGCGTMLKYASESLQMDLEIVCTAVENDAEAYEFVPEPLRFNSKVALIAAEKYNITLPQRLLKDRALIKDAAVRLRKLGLREKRALEKMSSQTIIAKYLGA